VTSNYFTNHKHVKSSNYLLIITNQETFPFFFQSVQNFTKKGTRLMKFGDNIQYRYNTTM